MKKVKVSLEYYPMPNEMNVAQVKYQDNSLHLN